MKKISSVILTALLLLTITACSNGNPAKAPSSTGQITKEQITDTKKQEESTTAVKTETTTVPVIENSVANQFETPWGGALDLSEAKAFGPDGELSLNDLTEDNWNYVSCNYVYLAVPSGIAYNSEDNADVFDENNTVFTDAPEKVKHEYKRYYPGDIVCGLTIKNCSTTFCPETALESPKYFNGGKVFFEGELTLTGKLRLAPEDDIYIRTRDLQFVPNKDSCLIPIMNYDLQDNEGCEPLNYSMENGVVFLGEYSLYIALGNVDEYEEINFSGFPGNGDWVDVKITISDIALMNEFTLNKSYSGTITRLEMK